MLGYLCQNITVLVPIGKRENADRDDSADDLANPW
jgi:hypothetical protein